MPPIFVLIDRRQLQERGTRPMQGMRKQSADCLELGKHKYAAPFT